MADVALSVETRSQRSRSKTPGILFGENGDSEKRVKKIPTISLIEEEDVVEVVSSSQGPRTKRNRRSAKVTTDASAGEVAVESTVTKTTVKETVIKKSINGSGESSEQTTVTTTQSSTKAALEAAEAPENQSIFNNILNAIKTSTPIVNTKRSKRTTQEVSSSGTGINIADHPAYKEYKDSGEYWNNTPKTDYTYSELSPHRRVLSNGSVALPNMSRRSLENHHGRVQVMIQSNPTEESFLRRKFLSTNNYSFQKRSADLQYDSADEVDVSDLRRSLQARRKPESNIISRFFLMVINSMYNFSSSVKRTFTGSNQRYAYTPIRKQHGIVRRSYESFKTFFLLGFSQVYLFVSTVLCMDTWILYTRSENVIENRRRKRFLLLLLILLPLLLLGAWLLSDDSRADKILNFTLPASPDLTRVTRIFDNLPSPRLPEWNFSLGWLWAPFWYLGGSLKGFLFTRSSKEELKMALDEDRLQALMAYIDNYIDSAILQKLDENNQIVIKQTTDKMTLLIVNNVKESLVHHHYQLTDIDVALIAARVKEEIDSEFSDKEKVILSKVSLANDGNMAKIEEQIKRNVNLHYTDIKLNNQNVNLDDIIAALLKSDKLIALIDGRLQPAVQRLDQHDVEIDEIKSRMVSLKAELMTRFTSIEGEVVDLKKNVGDDFFKLKLKNDEQLQQMLLEIDARLASLGDTHFSSVDASVRKNLLNILGFDLKSSGGDVSEDSIRSWISSVFVAKADLEERLKLVEANGNKAFQLQLDHNAGVLMEEINKEIRKEIVIALAAAKETRGASSVKISGGLSEADVLKIVKGVLSTYDADKTGLVDFALESAGGQILSTRCTENFQVKSAEISIFGIPLWYPSNTPRTVISPSVQPGECWAFQGFPGYVVIQLNNMIQITGFTIEHISKSLAPNGIIDSAPNKFTVWGLVTEMDKDPLLLGTYSYSADKDTPSLQYFPVSNAETFQPYQIIELRVESNHGNPRYTCLYRFRVHGNVVKR